MHHNDQNHHELIVNNQYEIYGAFEKNGMRLFLAKSLFLTPPVSSKTILFLFWNKIESPWPTFIKYIASLYKLVIGTQNKTNINIKLEAIILRWFIRFDSKR